MRANIVEALLEGWKHGLRNTWWIVDYNRQGLDAVLREGLWQRFETIFRNFGWDGTLQRAAFAESGGGGRASACSRQANPVAGLTD